MELLTTAVEFLLHFDVHLQNIISLFGIWTYVILFAVVFVETGIVIMPFLPGDSLLFIVGTFAGTGYLNILIAYPLLLAAAILGDSVNYWLGNKLGPKVFVKENSRLFNKKYLEMTREFYEKYGGKTIIIARFVPIVRTFAPFVAGIGSMNYKTFLAYNIIGGFIWVTSLLFLGYFIGNHPLVRNNFETAIYLIIGISLTPMVFEFIRHRLMKKVTKSHDETTDYKEIEETFEKEHLK